MKYICEHDVAFKALKSWAAPQRLITANHFFWNSGVPMQKSQNGLLQSLLYQVLLACPTIMPNICSTRLPIEPWTRTELFEALLEVSKQANLPAKFCFFIDGLDEYDGEHEELIQLLKDFTASACIKICVSSRPWNTFLDALDYSEWKLVLEDLTRNDIREYINATLVYNNKFAEVSRKDPRCTTLAPQITNRAQGVWLWVYFVVRDLLRDLKGEEGFRFLQRRLDSFPDELEDYFANILSRIDRIHRQETARIFLIAVDAVGPLPIQAFQFLHMEEENPDYAIDLSVVPTFANEREECCRRWRKLLNSRCRGLLEVND
jgi:hypothetical protein